mgnify:CR=1 FL=1
MKLYYLTRTLSLVDGRVWYFVHDSMDPFYGTEHATDMYAGENMHLKEDVRKYGRNCFEVRALHAFPIEEQAYAMLKRYEALSTYPIRTYYPDLTEEHKEKLRIANGGENNPFYGKKHTENTKKTLTEFRKRQRWVFKGEEERQIDAENPIPDGWAYGRSPLLREKMKALGNSNRKGKKKQVKNPL